jgi:large repetitive protein
MVKGGNGDSVIIDSSHVAGVADGHWDMNGITNVGGVSYLVFEHSTAHTELLVQQNLEIQVH